jgi:nitric oxide dioxygenase
MTPDEIATVREVIAAVGAHPEFAERFYVRLFEVAPEAAPMFGDIEAQRTKLADELAAMVVLLGDLPALDERARELGERHRGYGVRAAHYRIARTTMIDTLHEVLGDAFGEEQEAAWNRATMLITELMQAT